MNNLVKAKQLNKVSLLTIILASFIYLYLFAEGIRGLHGVAENTVMMGWIAILYYVVLLLFKVTNSYLGMIGIIVWSSWIVLHCFTSTYTLLDSFIGLILFWIIFGISITVSRKVFNTGRLITK